MTVSVYKVAIIVLVLKLLIVGVILNGVLGDNNPQFSGTGFGGGLENTETDVVQSSQTIQDYFWSDNANTEITYANDQIGNKEVVFRSTLWSILSSNILGGAKYSWARNDSDRIFINWLNLILSIISIVAYFEIYQLIRGKFS